jgi:hypothetical protein
LAWDAPVGVDVAVAAVVEVVPYPGLMVVNGQYQWQIDRVPMLENGQKTDSRGSG